MPQQYDPTVWSRYTGDPERPRRRRTQYDPGVWSRYAAPAGAALDEPDPEPQPRRTTLARALDNIREMFRTPERAETPEREPFGVRSVQRNLVELARRYPVPGMIGVGRGFETTPIEEVPPEERNILQDFVAGFESGRRATLRGVGTTLESLGLERVGRALREGREPLPNLRPRERTGNRFVDVLRETVFDVGSGVATTVPSIVGGVVGTAVGGPVGGAVGALAPAAGITYGGLREELEEEGVDPQTASRAAAVVTPLSAALEVLVPLSIGRRLLGGAGQQATRGLAREIARGALREGVTEAATEAAQTALERGAVAATTPQEFFSRETLDQILRAARAGGLTGGLLGGAATAVGDIGPRTPAVDAYLAELERLQRKYGDELQGITRAEAQGLERLARRVAEEAGLGEEVLEPIRAEERPPREGRFTRFRRRIAEAISPELRREATEDPLTGLANRGADERATSEALRERAPGTRTVRFRVDLDNFKALNDTMGHAAGDEALRTVASALRGALREGDAVSVARPGGDEFAITLRIAEGADPTTIRDRLEEAVNRALEEAGLARAGDRTVSASIGFAEARSGMSAEELDRLADQAAIARKRERGVSRPREEAAPAPAEPSVVPGVRMDEEASASADVDAVVEEATEGMAEPATAAEPIDVERVPTVEPERARPQNAGDVGLFPISEIRVDPKRFQFKADTDPETGAGAELKSVKKFDPVLAGVIQVWRDPADGQVYVVNGHHRLELARRLGEQEILVRFIEARDAGEARLIGAMTNIAEGRGTAIDAAKIFREQRITPEELERRGISLRGAIARDGMALANLPQKLFDDVVARRLSIPRAAIIGGSGLSEDQQLALAKLLEQRKNITNEEAAELVRFVKSAGETEVETIDLFGPQVLRQSLALEKAELSAYVKKQLAQDRRLFGYVGRGRRAQRIEGEGAGRIDVERAQAIAQQAAQAEEIYNRLSTSAGPISDALNAAAARLAAGEKADVVKRELYDQVRDAIAAELQALQRRASQVVVAERAQDPYQVSLFGEPETRPEPVQGELLPEGPRFESPRLSEAEAAARQIVSLLEGKVRRGAASKAEVERYEAARKLLARSQKISAEEMAAQARRAERVQPIDRDTGDLFAELPEARQPEPTETERPRIGQRTEPEEAPAAVPATPAADLPIRVSPDDIPYQVAYDAYRWNSFTPERRARQTQEEYVRHIEAVYEDLAPLARTEEQRRVLIDELERYRRGYVERELELLQATSRTASPMVTGPARFPVDRNRKALERVQRLTREFIQWRDRAIDAMRRKIERAGQEDIDPLEAARRELAEAEALQEHMKRANAIMRRSGLSDEQKRQAMREAGIPDDLIQEAFTPDPVMGALGFGKYRLENNNARIRRLRQRIEELERRATRTTREIRFDGGRIVENVEADRLQIFFDSVPSEEIRNQLKARGFRWSPREGAWQRQLTDNARIAASSILGVDLRGSDRPRIGERRVEYGATSFADQLQAFARDVRERHGLRLFYLFEDSNGNIVLDMIAVPRDRQGQGVGTAAMRDLIAFADRHGRRITLKLGQRDPEFGTTSRSRLERFYRRFGFVPNKGRNKDYSISADMYRDPLGSPRVREQAERPRIGESRATWEAELVPGLPADIDIASPTVRELIASGRWNLSAKEVTGRFLSPGERFEIRISPRLPEGIEEIPATRPGGLRRWYDPQLAEVTEDGDIRLRADSGLSQRIPAEAEAGFIYRGMSAEELAEALERGYLQSRGEYNLAGQEGFTFFAEDPRVAASYATGFQPYPWIPTFGRPGFVVKIGRPDNAISGTATVLDGEVAVPGRIDVSEIEAIYEAVPYEVAEGVVEINRDAVTNQYVERFRSSPDAYVAWRTTTVAEARRALRGLARPRIGERVVRETAPVYGVEDRGLEGTKVVDENGEPKVVYHGTMVAFEEFDERLADPGALFGPGFYFTEDAAIASSYTTKYHPAVRRWSDEEILAEITRLERMRERDLRSADESERRAQNEQQPEHVRENLRYVAQVARIRAETRSAKIAELRQLLEQPTPAPNVRPARLAIRNPFDVNAPLTFDENGRVSGDTARLLELARQEHPGFRWDSLVYQLERVAAYADANNGSLYNAMQNVRSASGEPFGKARLNRLLQRAGYDGITHIGGRISGNREHRVWIAFRRDQIRSAFGPAETAPQVGEARPTYAADITQTPEFRRWFGNSKVVDEHGRPLVVYHGTTAEFDVFERRSADLGFHAGSPEAANAIFESKSDGIRPRPAPLEGRRIMPLYMRIENPLRVRDLDSFSFLTLGPELERLGLVEDGRAWSEEVYNEGVRRTMERWAREYPGARTKGDLEAAGLSLDDQLAELQDAANEVAIERLEAMGYDGLVYENRFEGGGDSWVAFRPEQIKSAIGNRGTFDPTDPSIIREGAPLYGGDVIRQQGVFTNPAPVDWNQPDNQYGVWTPDRVRLFAGVGPDAQVYRALIPADELTPELVEDADAAAIRGGTEAIDDTSTTNPPPPVVRRRADGSYEILGGNHRIALWQELGHDGIPAWVIEDPTRGAVHETAARYEPLGALEGTKVVDENGEPKVVYHGTPKAFVSFDESLLDPNALYGPGFYFTEDPEIAGGVIEPDVEIRTFRTREEAERAPGRRGFVWSHGPNEWYAQIVVGAKTVRPGYAFKLPGRMIVEDPAIRRRLVQEIERNAGWMLTDPGYLSQTEREAMRRYLDQFEKVGDVAMLIDLLGGQPYNVRVLDYAVRTGALGQPNVRPARLAIRNPFDINALVTIDEDGRVAGETARLIDLARREYPDFDWDYLVEQVEQIAVYENPDNEMLYNAIRHVRNDRGQPFGKVRLTELLQRAGYDGITHIGGRISGGREHRVWIAFRRDQIRSAFGPANRATVVGERRNRRGTDDQLELTFGSVDEAKRVVRDIAEEAGDLLQISIPGVPTTKERIEAVKKGREAAFAWVPATGQRLQTRDGHLDYESMFRLLRVYRHPAAEYWHVLVVAPDEQGQMRVVHHRMSSSGAIDTALVHAGDIVEAGAIARRLGGRVVLAHNHPSGNPTPSFEDRSVTQQAIQILNGIGAEFGGHFVINHEAARVIESDLSTPLIRLPAEPDSWDWNIHDRTKQIVGPESVADYLSALPFDEARVDVLLLNTQHEVIAFEPRPIADLDRIADWLPGLQRETAAPKVVIGTYGARAYERAIRAANSILAVGVLDVVDVPSRASARTWDKLDVRGLSETTPSMMPIFEEGQSYGTGAEGAVPGRPGESSGVRAGRFARRVREGVPGAEGEGARATEGEGGEGAVEPAVARGRFPAEEGRRLRAAAANAPIVRIRGDEFGTFAFNPIDIQHARNRAEDYLRTHVLGTSVVNEATGDTIHFNLGGIRKTLSHAGNADQVRSLIALPELMRNAVHVTREPNRDPAQAQAVPWVHTYAARLQIGDRIVPVRLTVKEARDGRRFYDHVLLTARERALPRAAQIAQQQGAEIRQPWEMTRAEFEADAWFHGASDETIEQMLATGDFTPTSKYITADATIAARFPQQAGRQPPGKVVVTLASWRPRVNPDLAGTPFADVPDLRAVKADPSLRLTPEQAYTITMSGEAAMTPVVAVIPREAAQDPHRYLVEQALAEGLPVPAKVLADYPDLARRSAAVARPRIGERRQPYLRAPAPPDPAEARTPLLSGWAELKAQALAEGQLPPRIRGFASERLPDAGPIVGGTAETAPRPSDIQRRIQEGLQIKIGIGRFGSGRFMRSVLGLYKPGPRSIRLARYGDIATLGHELGHDMHALFFGLVDRKLTEDHFVFQPWRDELERLAEGISDQSLVEGWAEFWRRYIDNPDVLPERAPKLLAYVEERLERDYPALKTLFEQVQRDWRLYREASPQARIRAQISTGEEERNLGIRDHWRRFRTDIIDDIEPIRHVVEKLTGTDRPKDIQEDAATLARLVRGSMGTAEVFLEHGVLDFRTLRKVGPSLREVFEPVIDDLDDFRDYMVARRAQELHARDITTGIRPDDADWVVRELEKGERGERFKRTFARLQEYNRGLLKYLVDAGVMSRETMQKILATNQHYVPFYRVIDDQPQKGNARFSLGFGHLFSPVKRIKGSGRDIIDPIESLIKNTYLYVHIAARQQVSNALARLAERHGAARFIEQIPAPMVPHRFRLGEIETQLEKIIGKEPLAELRAEAKKRFEQETAGMQPGEIKEAGLRPYDPADEILMFFRPGDYFGKPNIISVLQDGKRVWYEVDPELYAALEGLHAKSMDALVRLLSAPARTLRAGAILAPEFMIRNPARDQLMAFVQSEYGFKPGVDFVRGLFSLLRKDDYYWRWKAAGGENAALVAMDRKAMRQNVERLLRQGGVRNVLKDPLDVLRAISAAMEDATRLGEFRRAVRAEGDTKAGLLRAAMASREISTDFARHGAKTEALRQIAAFWNARIQGYDRLVRALRRDPVGAMTRIGAGITLPSIILYAINRDDPEYWELPQWQRDLFWHVKIGGTWLRIPKPFELGIVFGTIPERILEWIESHDPEGLRESLKDFLVGEIGGTVLPSVTAVLPLFENLANYSLFFRRPIVPRSMQDVEPRFQATERTSEIAQLLGRWTNVSPMKIDNLLFGWTGGLGRLASQTVDVAVDLAREPERALDEISAARPEDVPGVRGVVTRAPGFSSESVERFYRRLQEARSVRATANHLEREERFDEADAFLAEPRRQELLAQLRHLERVADRLAQLRAQAAIIERDPSMPAAQKKREIEELGREAMELAREAIERRTPAETGTR